MTTTPEINILNNALNMFKKNIDIPVKMKLEGHKNKKQIIDNFLNIIYEFAGNIDRLYGDEFSLLESEDYDNKIAGIKLLGKDIAKVCDKPTLEKIKSIISEEIRDNPYSKLVTQMTGPFDDYEDILALLVKLYEGIIAN